MKARQNLIEIAASFLLWVIIMAIVMALLAAASGTQAETKSPTAFTETHYNPSTKGKDGQLKLWRVFASSSGLRHSSCSASRTLASGESVKITSSPRGPATVSVSGVDFATDRSTPALVQVQSKSKPNSQPVEIYAQNEGRWTTGFEVPAGFLKQFADADKLKLVVNGYSYVFDLAETHKAVDAVVACNATGQENLNMSLVGVSVPAKTRGGA